MNLRERYESAERMLADARNYPGLQPRPGATVQLRIWIAPSFQPWCSWSVLSEKKQHFVRRVTWDQSGLEINLEPTTYATEVPLEEGSWRSILGDLQRIVLPAFIPVNTIGIDGVRRGVEVGGYMRSCSFAWWGEAPEEWAALSAWHAEAVRRLQELLPASTVPLPCEP